MIEALIGKRILITGATGFIGSHLLRRFVEAGIAVTAVRYRPDLNRQWEGNIHWSIADLTDAEAVETIIKANKPDIVFHLAAKLGGDRSFEFAQQAVVVNFLGTHNLLSSLGRNLGGRGRIVMLGTSEEYGNSKVLPITEDQPSNPVSPYSASKTAATQFALLYHRLFDLPVVVLRPFIVYGPGQPPAMMIPELIQSVLEGKDFSMTEGKQTRDFVYVEDVVDCILAAATAKDVDGEVFNVSSGEERAIRTVAELIVRLMEGKSRLLVGARPYRQNEAWRLYGSNEKAQRLLGWLPKTTLEEGLRQTINWCRERYMLA
ncbi:MAG: GDP-mannose 4,6-dehydratase [Ignavibacteriae bacterium]|nr:GDP-mannose 4,6-dehydratase [Ignavibacteria bacterium]MBI3365940.1 GDP-mannose 4,6-dehydratase [Ignavibacteriota bacterium]